MKAKFLTGLVATTAAIATAFIGGVAEASNLKTSDPAFYQLLVDDYLLATGEGVALPNYANFALNGSIEALGAIDVFAVNADPDYLAFATYADRVVYSVNGGNREQAFKNFGTVGIGGRLDDAQTEVPDGEGFTINTNAGDDLDFELWTKGVWDSSQNAGLYLGADASQNIDNLQHLVAYNIKHAGYNWVYIGFEDISDLDRYVNGSTANAPDFDFNDVAIVIRNAKIDVPEPGVTLALLGIAAGSLSLRRRKDAE